MWVEWSKAGERRKGHISYSLVGHIRDYGLYPRNNGKPLIGFEQ